MTEQSGTADEILAKLSKAREWCEGSASVRLLCDAAEALLLRLVAVETRLENAGSAMMSRYADELGERWRRLRTPIYLVMDESGNNVADARVREDPRGKGWLYVDSVDGYSTLTASEVNNLSLELLTRGG